MSGLIGAAQPMLGPGGLGMEDLSLNREDFRPIFESYDYGAAAIALDAYRSEWWPSSDGMLIGSGDGVTLEAPRWSEYDPASGAASRYGFVGVTRDQYGTAIGSVTVKLYRTSDDVLLDTTTSNVTTGAFLLNTPYYPDAHYLVAHKTGSPDVDGVSVNTLIGT